MDETVEELQLIDLLKAGQSEDIELDKQKIRYALYARKSTTGEEKQASSIEDQIDDCMERVITPQALNVVRIYEEKASAKTADTREAFKDLVKDIQLGRINGVIAWHPDRLSRNMKEAGAIIDLVDTNQIKDLQFATFTFENNPAGKMLLGITFVMAKQYSEHLSESVDRGNRRAVEAGEFIGKFKHGYVIDASRHFQPDPDNFLLVKHMFDMALEGHSQREIRKWVNEQDYKVQKRPGADPVRHTWSKDDVSELVRDPHYAGVHKWGKNLIKLTEIYDFECMISEKEFLTINKISNLNSSKVLTLKRPRGGIVRADLLRGRVYCGHCKQTLTSMVIDKRKDGKIISSRYYYKCETVDCEMEGRSARAKVVIDEAKKFFSTYLFVTESNYDEYIRNGKAHIRLATKSMDSAIASLKVTIANKADSYERTKKLIENDEKLKKHYDLDKLFNEKGSLEAQYEELLVRRKEAPSSLLTYEEYLKLFKSTSVILDKIHDMKQMDSLLRIFFLNFTIRAAGKDFRRGSEVSYKLKEPWNGFLMNDDFVRGAG